ncbi:hypothetical protein HAX54_052868, partial [Datura stramonium]|nr:hypothetical protein [Datura stramonium]
LGACGYTMQCSAASAEGLTPRVDRLTGLRDDFRMLVTRRIKEWVAVLDVVAVRVPNVQFYVRQTPLEGPDKRRDVQRLGHNRGVGFGVCVGSSRTQDFIVLNPPEFSRTQAVEFNLLGSLTSESGTAIMPEGPNHQVDGGPRGRVEFR